VEVPSDQGDSPYGSDQPVRWRTMGALGANWRMPVPPGPPPESGKVRREQERESEARAEARLARLHLPGLLSGGVIVMGIALAAIVVLAMVAVLSHH
jgi:hypothetical protein